MIRKILIPALVLYTCVMPVRQGDATTRYAMEFIGFSADGSYCAYRLEGTHDGSGFPFCEIFFVDTRTGEIAGGPVSVVIQDMENAAGETACARADEKAGAEFMKYRILKDTPGTVLLNAFEPRFDSSGPQNVSFSHRSVTYQLVLTEKDGGSKKSDEDRGIYGVVKTFDLTIATVRGHRVLRANGAIPYQGRRSFKYRISSVRAYKNILAVFITAWCPGFEGPDSLVFVVTGKL